jgi:hypothetical protein
MSEGRVRRTGLGAFVALAALAAGQAWAAEPNVRSISAGLGVDSISRTVVWSGDETSSRIQASLVTARAELAVGRGLVFSLIAGFSVADVGDLTFDTLPVSLRFAGSGITGFALGAEAEASLKKFGDFEIGAAGRFVYHFGMTKTWPLEGFAVEGRATGQPSWLELAAGPRVAYLAFGRIVPYLELTGRVLWAGFRMTEVLGELEGRETKKVSGDLALGLAVGAAARVTDRIALEGRIGVLPRAGGADTVLSFGVLYGF